MKKYVEILMLFVLLTLVQVLVLNNVNIFGYGTPFLYIYLLLRMDTETKSYEIMLWAFFLGLAIDIFSDTPGLNAAASVALAFCRKGILKLYTTYDRLENCSPGIGSLGLPTYLKYALTCSALHSCVLMTVEFFSFAGFGFILLKILASTVMTVLCLVAAEQFRR